MPMDFFESQDVARRKTSILVFYFCAAVALIITAVYAVVVAAVRYAELGEELLGNERFLWWDAKLFGIAAGSTAAVILSGSLFKIAALSGGGAVVASMLGGRPVNPNTQDANQRRLLNVVEEMAIAAGTPVPPVFLLEDESSINAFAAGFSPGDAVIGVTRGTMEILSRDELQGVMAHEFSHILNGDMRLNIRLMGILHGILLIALSGYWIARSSGRSSRRSSRDNKGGGAIVLFGIALMVVGFIGVFFGKLIKSAVSRQREFLADASAVQFTRNPEGIAGALKKIGGLVFRAKIENPSAEQASHLFFGNALSESFLGLFATHPPLEERIKRIDPRFDGKFPKVVIEQADQERRRAARPPVPAVGLAEEPRRQSPDPATASFAASIAKRAEQRRAGGAPPLIGWTADLAVAEVGQVRPQHIAYATALIDSLPASLSLAARDPFGARAVIYGLLLDRDLDVRQAQLKRLANHADAAVHVETLRLVPAVAQLGDEARLPLVDLAVAALRELSPRQYAAFRANVDYLVEADQQVGLFEFVLQRLMLRHLAPQFQRVRTPRARYFSVKPLHPESTALLAALAYAGQTDEAAIQRAFAAGADVLDIPHLALADWPPQRCPLATIDAALDRLALGSGGVKKRILTASAACIGVDGKVTVAEGELLRAIADSLDCPMPPQLAAELVESAD